MGPFVMAWLVGEGILVYRSVRRDKTPPGPGILLVTSGVFVLLALLAEAEKARTLATTLAWGFDIAAYMNLTGTQQPSKSSTTKWPPPIAPNTIIIPNGLPGENQATIIDVITGTISGAVEGAKKGGLSLSPNSGTGPSRNGLGVLPGNGRGRTGGESNPGLLPPVRPPEVAPPRPPRHTLPPGDDGTRLIAPPPRKCAWWDFVCWYNRNHT